LLALRANLNIPRCRRLIEEAIKALSLDLTGLTVLTEAATGPFALTASIAALAGADRVIALARDSRYGSSAEATSQTLEVARSFGIADRLFPTTDRGSPLIGEADIITNLGPVRPLDRSILSRLKPTAAISLMFEPWEFRHEDIDLAACREIGVPILGTNESVASLRTLDYLTPVVISLLFECGIEVVSSRLVVLGSGYFVDALAPCLTRLAEKVDQLSSFQMDASQLKHANTTIAQADALIIAEHHTRNRLIGEGGNWTASELANLNPGLAVIHVAGNVDRDDIAAAGLVHAPNREFAPPGYMSVTTAHVGPRPLVTLHAGGLKVGEMLARRRLAGDSRLQAELGALKESSLCLPVTVVPLQGRQLKSGRKQR
jgi:hypothetical protein